MADNTTNNRITTTVELDATQAQVQISKLNGIASDTTKKLETRLEAKNKVVKIQNDLSKKTLSDLTKEVNSLKGVDGQEKKLIATQKKLNAARVKASKISATNTKQQNKLGASMKSGGKSSGMLSKLMGGLSTKFLAWGAVLAGVAKTFQVVIGKGIEFSKSLSDLRAVAGATQKEIKLLSSQARELGSTTVFTASEVVELQTELAKLGLTVAEIKDSTPAVLDLAASLEVGLADAAKFTGSIINSFGLEASDAARVVDVMASAAANSAQDFSTLKESFVKAAPAAAALGVSVERTSALLGVIANAGIIGSEAGNSLKNAFIELKKEGLTLDEGLEKIKNSSDALGTAIDLAGKRGGPALLILAKGGKDLSELEKTFLNSAGAAKEMAEIKLDNISGDVTKLKSAFEGFTLSVFDGTGVFAGFIRGVLQGTTAVLNFFTSNDKLSDTMEEQRTSIFKAQIELASYSRQMNSAKEGSDELKEAEFKRFKVIKDIQKEYPGFLENLDIEKVSTEDLNDALEELNKTTIARIALQRRDEGIDEQNEKTADAFEELAEVQDVNLTRAAELRKAFGEIGIELEGNSPEAILKSASEQLKEGRKGLIAQNKEYGKNIDFIYGLDKAKNLLGETIKAQVVAEEGYNKEFAEGTLLIEARNKFAKDKGVDGQGEIDKKARDKKEAQKIIDAAAEDARIKTASVLQVKNAKRDAKAKLAIEKNNISAIRELNDSIIKDRQSKLDKEREEELSDLTLKKEEVLAIENTYLQKQNELEEENSQLKGAVGESLLDQERAFLESRRQLELSDTELRGSERLAIESKYDLLEGQLEQDKEQEDIAREERAEERKTKIAVNDESIRQAKIQQDALDSENKLAIDELEYEQELIDQERKIELEGDKLVTLERDFERELEFAERKRLMLLDNENLTASEVERINAESTALKKSIGQKQVDAAKAKDKAILDSAISLAGDAFGISKEIALVEMAIAAPKAIGDVWKNAANKKTIPGMIAHGVVGTATVLSPIVKSVSAIKKARFSKSKGKGDGPAPSVAPQGISTSSMSNISANNASRIAGNGNITNNANSAALNNSNINGGGQSLIFSEGDYSSFQDQIDFREGISTID